MKDAARAERAQPLRGTGRPGEALSSEKVSEVNWAGQCSDKGLGFCNLLICDSIFFLYFYFFNYYFFSPPGKRNINIYIKILILLVLVLLPAIKFLSPADSKGEVRGKDISLPGRDVIVHHHFRRGNLPLNKYRSFCGGTGVELERT